MDIVRNKKPQRDSLQSYAADDIPVREKSLMTSQKRDLSAPHKFRSPKARGHKDRVFKKEKDFLEEVYKKNMEKTVRVLKSSIPSYFSRHFRDKKDLISLTSSDSANRLLSPSALKELQPTKNYEHCVVPIHPIASLLQASNGIDLYRIIDPNYKFFIAPGNNDALVRKILSAKPGWSKSFSPHSANLIWTDVKKSAIFDLIPKGPQVKKTQIEPQAFENPLLPEAEYVALSQTALLNPHKVKIYNKLEGNSELASKKKLFHNMFSYYKSIGKDPFTVIPLTYHMTNGCKDPSFLQFCNKYTEIEELMKNDPFLNNVWIVKPGEATNRGIGIKVCSSVAEVMLVVDEKKVVHGIQRTYIVQKYLYKPLLYINRKFDIRCYLLVTIINSNIQAYFYKEGYMRTSCQEFDMSNVQNKYVHLTNDAVQKHSPDYGKFEDGNKLSYDDFQTYIDSSLEKKVSFKQEVYPKMRDIVRDTIKATYKQLDPHRRTQCFEVYGYDFMLDENFQPWLIEINTNPCLALSGKYLTTLIPKMLNHSFEIVLDQLFPIKKSSFEGNLYELIFSESNYK